MKAAARLAFDNAVTCYLAKLESVVAPCHERDSKNGGFFDKSNQILMRSAGELAHVSAGLNRVAHNCLSSSDAATFEGIRSHLLGQATAELLISFELLSLWKDSAPSEAALRATNSAALRDAVSDVEKCSGTPVSQGPPLVVSCRAAESSSIEEAGSGLQFAIECTISNISRRVQELSCDISQDLLAGYPESSSVGSDNAGAAAALMCPAVAGSLLMNALQKISMLADMESLPGDPKLWGADRVKAILERSRFRSLSVDLLNRACDLIKGLSDNFTILTGRMRKLEDAIRLGSRMEIPPLRPVTTALQRALLSALVSAGRDYVERGLPRVLQTTGIHMSAG